jgi:hypothetical protein
MSHIEGFYNFVMFSTTTLRDNYNIQNSKQRSCKPMAIKSYKNIKQDPWSIVSNVYYLNITFV